MAEAKSFLGETKEQLVALFADAYDQIHSEMDGDVPDIVPTTLQKLQRKTWELMEGKLKDSYRNGQKAGPRESKPRASHEAPAAVEPRSNPFRK